MKSNSYPNFFIKTFRNEAIRLFVFFTLMVITQTLKAQCAWSPVGNNDTSLISRHASTFTSMVVDKTDSIYIAYSDNTLGSKATVKKLKNGNWRTLGVEGFTAGTAMYNSLAVSNLGVPYLAFVDKSSAYKVSVMKFIGNSWVLVGNAGFSAGGASYTTLALTGSGTPYVSYIDSANGNKATVKYYNGSSWLDLGVAGFTPGSAAYLSMKMSKTGVPYVGFQDGANSSKATVMSYNGTTWTNIGTAGFSAGIASYISITLDTAGKPYIVYNDRSNNSIAVKSYDGNSWVAAGGYVGSSGYAQSNYILIDNNNSPYIFTGNQRVTIYKLNGAIWSGVASWGPSLSGSVLDNSLTLGTDSQGNIFAGLIEGRIPAVNKIIGSRIISIGMPGVSGDYGGGQSYSYNCLAVNSAGTPYFVNSSQGLVLKYNGSSWNYEGNPNSTSYYYPALIFDSVQTPYISYLESNNYLSVKKFDGTSWVNLGGIGFADIGSYRLTSLTIDRYGKLYAAAGLKVFKYNGTSWDAVGSNLAGKVAKIGLTAQGEVMVVYSESFSNNGKILHVAKFDGTAWVDIIPAFTFIGSGGDIVATISRTGIVFISISGYIDGPLTVVKFDGSTWSFVGGQELSIGTAGVNWPNLETDNNSAPYICFLPRNSGSYPLRMYRFDGTNWVSLGDALNSNIEQSPAFTIDKNTNTPYVSFGNFCSFVKKADCSQPYTYASVSIALTMGTYSYNCIGSPTTFTATPVNGGSSPTYQWKLNGINAGTNSPIFTTTSLTLGQNNISCVMTSNSPYNLSGPVTDSYTGLTASLLPAISIYSSTNTTICLPGSVTLNAPSGINGATYQWNLNNNPISGATNRTYVTSTVGSYSCSIAFPCGISTSNTLVLTSTNLLSPVISASGPTNFCSGGSVTLSATSGSGLTYQWYASGSYISGATTSSYIANSSGSFTCNVTNACGTYSSNAIQVSTSPSLIASGPTMICQGGSVTLSLNAPATSYQWNLNSAAILGATNPTYLATSAGTYSCTLINACGTFSVYSITVTVVNSPPTVTLDNPVSTNICPGGLIQLHANATNGLYYQWNINGTAISGATSSYYSATAVGNYTCQVSNLCGSVTSNAISISLYSSTPASIVASGAPILCSGGSITLTANYINNFSLTYQWYLNGIKIIPGGTARILNISVPGNYTCDVTSTCGTTTSNAISVTYLDLSSFNITASGPTSFCQGNTVSLTATSVAGLDYSWTLNNYGISGATGISYVASASGNYFCVLSSTGCLKYSNTITVAVNTPSTVITASGNTSLCPGGAVLLTANAATSYQWNLNGLAINGATLGSYTASAAGTYTCTSSYSCGSATSNAIVITMNSLPNAIISSASTSFCAGGSITLSANTGSGFQWQLNNVAISGATFATYQATAAGSYSCYVTNSCGSATSNSIAITMNSVPSATISSTTTSVCAGGNILLSAITGVGLSYQWKQNTITISGATAATYSATAAASYTCDVTNSCGKVTSNAIAITVNPLPTASISSASTSVCAGGSISLSANTGAGLSYQWKLNTVAISGATATTYAAAADGSYTCAVTNSCGTVTSNAIVITVYPLPTASISSATTSVCAGGSISLSANTGAGLSYQWKLNTVAISGATASTYAVTAAGAYTCDVTNSCGMVTSNAIVITVNPLPTASISSATTSVCAGSGIVLSANTGSGLSYQWKFNTVTLSGATASTFSGGTSGSFTCDVTNSCGTVTSNAIVITVNQLPTASISSATTNFCSGGNISLSANSGAGLSYQWKLNTVAISAATAATYSATAAGSYTCDVTNSCGKVTSNAIVITLNPLPTASISSATTSVCAGGSITLSANTGAGLSYQWKLNTLAISGATAATYAATAAGSYTCVVTNSCGSTTSNSIVITINPAPNATINSSATSFCTGGSMLLSAATGAGYSYQWKRNTTNITGATASTYTATSAGTYTCSVTNACSTLTSNPIVLTVTSLPVATITASGPTSFCQGGSVTLTAPSAAGNTYQWKIGGVSVVGATASTYVATTSGTHKCTITNACGSVTSNIITVTILAPVATITASGATTFCGGGSVVLSATAASGQTYVWKKDGTTISGASASAYTATTTGNYKCSISNSCGTSTSNIISVIAGKPAKPTSITGTKAVCPNATQSYSVASISTATSYVWTVPAGATITAGQGTAAVSVKYGATVSGNIGCAAINTCGTGVVKTSAITLGTTCPAARSNEFTAIEISKEDVLVYPNPSDMGIFTINFKGNVVSALEVMDMQGKKVYEDKAVDATAAYILKMQDLPKGVYFLRMQTDGGNVILRLQK